MDFSFWEERKGKEKWNLLIEGRGERLIPDLQYFPLSGRKTERGRCQLVCNGFIQTWWKPAPRRILTKLFWQWNPPLLIFNKATATFSQRCKGTEIDNSIWRYSIFEAISFQENLDEQGSQVSIPVRATIHTACGGRTLQRAASDRCGWRKMSHIISIATLVEAYPGKTKP